MRGEYIIAQIKTHAVLGSPPLARGVPIEGVNNVRTIRITPACAGSTDPQICCFCSIRDHPRLRGEYATIIALPIDFLGSPPLARGVLQRQKCLCADGRITPACAGSTDRQRRKFVYGVGSPPLARGVHILQRLKLSPNRITPACAGSTRYPAFV